MKSTPQQFEAFQRLYDYYNQALFNTELPDVLLNFTRQNQVAGHFVPVRWKATMVQASSEGTDNGHEGQQSAGRQSAGWHFAGQYSATRHEIAIHPRCLCRGKKQFIQTLVHEMVHLWQYEYGRPSRAGYHNREWADKMIAVGLIPSSTGKPGGYPTGQSMSDYIQLDGKLEQAMAAMPAGLWLPFEALEYTAFDATALEEWLYQRENDGSGPDAGALTSVKQLLQAAENQQVKKRKLKYTCVSCGINAWGKPGLRIRCEACDISLLSVE